MATFQWCETPYPIRSGLDHACLASFDLEVLSKCMCQVASLDSSVGLVISLLVSSHCLRLVEVLSKCMCQVASLDSSVGLVISLLVSSHCLRLVLRSMHNFTFLNKLFQLDIHPGHLSFADRLNGDGLSHYWQVTEGLQTFGQ